MKKRILSLILALALLWGLLPQMRVTAHAEVYSGNCGAEGDGSNLTWSFDEDTGVLTIAGSGDMHDYSYSKSAPWYYRREKITSVLLPQGLTSIGNWAFYGCFSLTSVEIPDSVISIGGGAFRGCSSLTSVEIPNSVTSIGDGGTFDDCRSLTSVTIGNGVTSIGSQAFRNCRSLTSVTIGNGVTSIGSTAFEGCSSLTSVEIPNSVTSIDSWAFEHCRSLTSVTIGNSVTSIGGWAFVDCSSLTSVEIPASVTSIHDEAFGYVGYGFHGGAKPIDGFTVYGYADTEAERYANGNGFLFVPIGEGSASASLSDEITHLIFADMAYAQIPVKYEGYTVDAWLETGDYPGFIEDESDSDKHGMTGPMFSNSSMTRKDVYRMVGDWKIIGLHYGDSGYADAVFQKGNKIIIAFPGTENIADDVAVDAEFAVFNYLDPGQFKTALETYNAYADKGTVSLTGHSLGGALVTHVATLTGAKGYSFDGAAGHVIDLTYLTSPEKIPFHSKDQMTFTNYTDQAGVSLLADLIQHTNADMFPGIDYKFNHDYRSYYPFGCKSHHIYSITKPSADGKTLELMDVVKTNNPKGKDSWYMSVDFSKVSATVNALIAGFASGGNPLSMFAGAFVGDVMGRPLKIGSVHLGTENNDQISVIKNIHNLLDATAVVSANVIYGGDGTDELIGAAGPDVLVPGELKGDRLSGGLGSDYYLLNFNNPGEVYISDSYGSDTIKLIGAASISFDRYDSASNSYRFKCGTNRYVYIRQTILNHKIRVVNEKDVLINILKTGLMQYVMNTEADLQRANSLKNSDNLDEIDVACKEVCIEGCCLIDVFAPDGTLVATYDTARSGLYMEDFGTVNVTESDGVPFLDATIYESYTMKARGNNTVNVCIVGSDAEYHVDHVTLAEDVSLTQGEATVEPENHLVIQGAASAVTQDTLKSVSVSISKASCSLEMGATTELTAQTVFEDKSTGTGVYWISTDPSVVSCQMGENGTCLLKGEGVGEAEVYAVAEDSGFTAVCKVQVTHQHTRIQHEAKAPTCTEIGWKAYETCSGCDYTSYVELPALGHDWTAPSYTWAEDNSSVTASRACKHDASHVETETVTASYQVTKEATTEAEGEGSYTATFTNEAFKVQTKTVSLPKLVKNPFEDVKESDFFFNPVLWATTHVPPITAGVAPGYFGPNNPCTREQIVTFLWAVYGKPELNVTGRTFSDVPADAWYYKPVMWAVENKVTSGLPDGSFGVGQPCTRAQAMTFLWASKGKPAPSSMESPFSDVSSSDWFCKAILWAAENGITKGVGNGLFGVNDTCTRAQIITFLYKAYN